MLLDSEENINKVDWFISKNDNNIYGLYRGFILYSFDPNRNYEKCYYIEYTDRSYTSRQTINIDLLNKIRQKELIKYDSINFYLKIKNREKIIDSIL